MGPPHVAIHQSTCLLHSTWDNFCRNCENRSIMPLHHRRSGTSSAGRCGPVIFSFGNLYFLGNNKRKCKSYVEWVQSQLLQIWQTIHPSGRARNTFPSALH